MFGFARVGLAIPRVKVADPEFNAKEIISLIREANKDSINVVVFPEFSITSYTSADLFHQEILLKKSEEALGKILAETKDCAVLSAVGLPILCDNQLFNCAVVVQDGRILGIVPKTYIPTYKEFYEKRWFSSAKNLKSKKINFLGTAAPIGTDILFRAANFPKMIVGVEICEDLWVPIPPSTYQALAGATLHLNLSASNAVIGKADYRRSLVSQQSARCISAYAYCSCGVGESTTDLVFDGHGIIAENGAILAESERFLRSSQLVTQDIDFERLAFDRRQITSFGDSVRESNKKFRIVEFDLSEPTNGSLKREVQAYPFVPQDASQRDKRCEEIFSIQVAGLAKRMESGKQKRVLIGISGGLDSTLTLLVAVRAFDALGLDRKNILALTMPGFATSSRTKDNAIKLCQSLGVSLQEIDIKKGCLQQYSDIGHDANVQDTVFENVQARYRTFTLFSKGNQSKCLVLGTGDLSEIALGWCTYNGDHMSHYNVNASIPKTLVKYLIKWAAETQVDKKTKEALDDILATPVSPELTSVEDGKISQKTEEIIGPYELHDFFLYHLVRWGMAPKKILFLAEIAFKAKYSAQEINNWLKLFIARFWANQWKRSCVPDSPKVGSVSLSPRGDWRMPSDAEVRIWLENLEEKEAREEK